MKKMFSNEKMQTPYESPSMTEIQLACEGVLCQSGADGLGTESLDELLGEW